ncbi:MAG: hypothetical protein IT257_08255, partial [Chitinophagaceae bacterium]|nr:hypothetical protein [Chitinophagaceae bacterium]
MISQFNAHIETGTKAKNLFTMRELDLQVPPFCVLPHAELQNLLHDQGLPYSKEGIMAVLIPENWIDEIDALLPQVSSYAVRSSTALEDGAQLSYAGQFCSLLNVQNNQLKSAIKQVWQSPFEAHVAAYQTHTDISTSIPISIIIQECVSAEVSGVAFSCDPLNPDTETMLINSVYGLGEGLVSGQLEADQYWVRNAEISKTEIAPKTEKLIYHSSGNLQKVTVEESLIHSSSLSDSQCLELAKITKELEAHFGCAQDLEFCYAKQQLYILQSRPITALRPQTENYLVWDNSNIVESYPGITLPLTFS